MLLAGVDDGFSQRLMHIFMVVSYLLHFASPFVGLSHSSTLTLRQLFVILPCQQGFAVTEDAF